MSKLFLLAILVFSTLILKGQDQYSNGFSTGYRKGYCYGKELGCIAPIPPIPPIPSIGESLDNYQDGYNKGFSMALEEQNTSNQGQSYHTTSPQLVDFIYKLDAKSILELAAAQRQLKGVAFENYKNKEYNTCIYLCSKILPTDPYDSELYMLIGMSYYGEKNYQQALYNLRKARVFDPTNNMYDKAIMDVEKDYNNSKN